MAPTLRPRRDPLSTLPLHHFAFPAGSGSSPSSSTRKRSSSVLSTNSTPQKVSKGNELGASGGSIKRTRDDHDFGVERSSSEVRQRESRTITPRVKRILDKSEFGTGKSPARRLFGYESEERPISGISGAVLTPPSKSRSRDYLNLAPSPPIDERSGSLSYFTARETNAIASGSGSGSVLDAPRGDNGEVIEEHDPGFIVHPDQLSGLLGARPGALTPLSKPRARVSPSPAPTPSSSISAPSSPSLSYMGLENQENIPPPVSSSSTPSKYHHVKSTPSVVDGFLAPSSSHSHSTSTHTSGGTPGSRRRERSKLVNELLILRGEISNLKDRVETKAELTPGRRTTRNMAREKERLAREVDEA